ncbi:DUF1016 N-terminal domain-containing protein [Treponema sp. TIM-1]|uniref:DUF1016 N-terminal domain-containing protein n=1 Tax=Treponema sp. TIM-1 TaxID=2898417 RepID=UPI0039814136
MIFEIYRDKPKLAPLVRELTWTNNIIIMARAKTEEAQEFYIKNVHKKPPFKT